MVITEIIVLFVIFSLVCMQRCMVGSLLIALDKHFRFHILCPYFQKIRLFKRTMKRENNYGVVFFCFFSIQPKQQHHQEEPNQKH